jgi:hypothetical protein
VDRILETAGLASVGGWLRRRGKHAHFEPGAPCPNCATPLQGPWCYACGQSGEDFHRSVFKLIAEAFEGLFHADGRLWRTLPALLVRPGKLTRAYLDGRRAPQVPPFRMFLVLLLLVFFAGHLATSRGSHEEAAKPHAPTAEDLKERREKLAEARAELAREIGPEAARKFDQAVEPLAAAGEAAAPAEKGAESGVLIKDGGVSIDGRKLDFDDKPNDGPDERWLKTRIRAIRANPERFALILEIWAHRVAILALPVSALLLTLLFAFNRRFYVFDHLVFSMHSLSFQLLLLTTIFLLSLLIGGAAWWLILLMPIHLYRHMRGTYGSGRFMTVARMFLLFIGSSVGFGLLAALWFVLGMNQMAGH